MPFGLNNAPATFMSIMNGIFHNEMDECVVVYIYDILIYSQNEVEHARDHRLVLEKLKENKLYVNAEKSEFALKELDFLDHVLGKMESARTRRKFKPSRSGKLHGRKKK